MTAVVSSRRPDTTGFPVVARQLASGVAILATGSPERPVGATVSTLTVAGHAPPLVSVVLTARGSAVAAVLRSGGFAATLLAAEQGGLARWFADPARHGRPAPGDWSAGRWGPLLLGGIGWLECRLERVVHLGEHQLLVAAVDAARIRPGAPLVSFAGALHAGWAPHAGVARPDLGGGTGRPATEEGGDHDRHDLR